MVTVRSRKPSSDESVLIEDIVQAFRILLTGRRNKFPENLVHARRVLSKVRSIFSNDATAEAFAYFCLNGAATAWILQTQLDMPEATAYRALKHLRATNIVTSALRVSKLKNSKGGPRPTIWAIQGATTEEISRALQLHYRMLSPKFRVAEQIAQTILDEYITPRRVGEISYREIVIKVKELRIPFSAPDIADLTANYLHEKGVKVWR